MHETLPRTYNEGQHCDSRQSRTLAEDVPYLIVPCSRHISHPLHAAIVTLFEYLQVPHEKPGAREHEQGEAQVQWRSGPGLLVRHACQTRFGAQDKLALSSKTRDFPDNIVVFWFVLCFALGGSLCDACCIQRGRYAYDYVGRKEFRTVICSYCNAVFHLGLTDLVDDSVHLERQIDVFRGTISHQFKLAIRGNEGYDSVRVKLAKLDTLMELAVL